MIAGFDRSETDDALFQRSHRGIFIVGIKTEDGREVHLAGTIKFQAIGFGTGESLFVGIDLALSERFDANTGHESFADVGFAFPSEFLMIDVEGFFAILCEDAALHPAAEKTGGAVVLFIGGGIAGFFAVEFESDDVAGVFFIEVFLLLDIDDVIRGGGDVGEIADL